MKGSLVLDVDEAVGALSNRGAVTFGSNWEIAITAMKEDRLDDGTDWAITGLDKVVIPGEFL